MIYLFIILFSLNSWSNQSTHFIIDFSNKFTSPSEKELKFPYKDQIEKCNSLCDEIKDIVTTNRNREEINKRIVEFNHNFKKELKIGESILTLGNKTALELYDGYEGIRPYNAVMQIDIRYIHNDATFLDFVAPFRYRIMEAMLRYITKNIRGIPLILQFLNCEDQIKSIWGSITKVLTGNLPLFNAPIKIVVHPEEYLPTDFVSRMIDTANIPTEHFFSLRLNNWRLSEDSYYLELAYKFKHFERPFALDISENDVSNREMEYLVKVLTDNENLYKLNITNNIVVNKKFINRLNVGPAKLSKIIWERAVS